MDLNKKPNGLWELRWREGKKRRGRTFDRKSDAAAFDADRRRRRQLGQAYVPDDVPLAEFIETYWRLHAVPNLSDATRALYKRTWVNHIAPRLGDYGVREIDVPRLVRFRTQLERAGVGDATAVKAMTIVQSILTFAISEGLLEHNPARDVRKPEYERAREPHIFLPAEVEQVRARCATVRDRTLVSLLAYSGPRPEEAALRLLWEDVGTQAIRYRDTKRGKVRHTPLLAPLADDMAEWFMASGRPGPRTPVFPAHDGDLWDVDDWRNWRGRVWRGEPERKLKHRRTPTRARVGIAPAGTRPRDLRSSYVTLRVYEGVPLTTIAREVGTSLAMLDKHYSGVIANWDGRRVPAEEQIREARLAA